MCNARNHPPGCNCGWGGGWHSGGYGSSGGHSSFFSTMLNSSGDSYRSYSSHPAPFVSTTVKNMNTNVLSGAWTEPNATCPECGHGVYFVQTDNGGRVYFDELGPPWPKHVCTANAEDIKLPSPRDSRWDRLGWKPLLNFTTTVAGFNSDEGYLMRVNGEDENQKIRYFVCRIKDDVEFDIFRFTTNKETKTLSILAHNKKGEFLVYEGSSNTGEICHLISKSSSNGIDLESKLFADWNSENLWTQISNVSIEKISDNLYRISGSSDEEDVAFQIRINEFYSPQYAKFQIFGVSSAVISLMAKKSGDSDNVYILEGPASAGKSFPPGKKLEIKKVISRIAAEGAPVYRTSKEYHAAPQNNLLNKMRAIDSEIDDLLKKIAALNQEKTKLIENSVGQGFISG